MDGELEIRYRKFFEVAKEENKHKQFEACFRSLKTQGLCTREAIEIAAWNLNLPGRPW